MSNLLLFLEARRVTSHDHDTALDNLKVLNGKDPACDREEKDLECLKEEKVSLCLN